MPARRGAKGKQRRPKQPAGGASSDEDSDGAVEQLAAEAQDALLRGAPSLLGRSDAISGQELAVKRTVDLNAAAASNSAVSCVAWHPNGRLALTAGFDKTLRLFRVDGTRNTLLQSVHLPKLQVASAAFSSDGARAFACGRGRQWACVDLHSGRATMMPPLPGREEAGYREVVPSPDGATIALLCDSGALLLLSQKSRTLLATLQPSEPTARFGGCQCVAYSPDGALLFASGGGNGRVQVWDVRRRVCIHTWHDGSGVRTTRIALSPDGRYVATGSDAGVVALYETAAVVAGGEPKALKEFMNVRTAITALAFNHSSELLAFASKYAKASMRVAHLATRRVYPNWPTSKTPLKYVQSFAFSPASGYLSFGNDKGAALLYRLNHFEAA